MDKINVLLIGSDARVHAIAWKAMQSPRAGTIYVAPGNPGTAMLGCKNIPLEPTPENFQILVGLAHHLDIGLVIVGPEAPLMDGIEDVFKRRGIPIFAPSRLASRIEWSKCYAKEFMVSAGIPTAPFKIFGFMDKWSAKEFIIDRWPNTVIKADGLMSGKGVTVSKNFNEAWQAIDTYLSEPGDKIVIEDRLEGEEISIHALSDGAYASLFPVVRDYKRVGDGNTGVMTGGMGAFGPINVDPGLIDTIMNTIVMPCIRELAKQGTPFVGCLYPGIMLTKDGPKVLEFNARFGDPETQILMRLLANGADLISVLLACTQGKLDEVERKDFTFVDEKCICVVLADWNYPNEIIVGDHIRINDTFISFNGLVDPIVFHSSTDWKYGKLFSKAKGGRVMSVTHMVKKPEDIASVYDWIGNTGNIHFTDMKYRKDIGKSMN